MKALVLFFGGLVVWGAVSGKTGGSGGPPTAATEIPTSGGHGTLVGVLVVVGLLALVAKAGGGGGRTTTSARPVLRTAGGYTRAAVVRHEKAHMRALRRAGVGGRTYRVWRERNGSWTGETTISDRAEAQWDALPPEKQIAVYAAGRHGSPRTPSRRDEAGIGHVLAGVPGRDRGRVRRKGESLARRWAR